jgi:hypothetical protein
LWKLSCCSTYTAIASGASASPGAMDAGATAEITRKLVPLGQIPSAAYRTAASENSELSTPMITFMASPFAG